MEVARLMQDNFPVADLGKKGISVYKMGWNDGWSE